MDARFARAPESFGDDDAARLAGDDDVLFHVPARGLAGAAAATEAVIARTGGRAGAMAASGAGGAVRVATIGLATGEGAAVATYDGLVDDVADGSIARGLMNAAADASVRRTIAPQATPTLATVRLRVRAGSSIASFASNQSLSRDTGVASVSASAHGLSSTAGA